MTKHRTKVADAADIGDDGDRILVEIDGIEIAVFRSGEDLFALSNYCVHQLGPVCEGRVIGRYSADEDGAEWTYDEQKKAVTCPWHGWMFDISSGDHLQDERYSLPTFEVEEEDGEIFVQI